MPQNPSSLLSQPGLLCVSWPATCSLRAPVTSPPSSDWASVYRPPWENTRDRATSTTETSFLHSGRELLAGMVSSEAALLGWWTVRICSLCRHLVTPLSTHVCVPVPSSTGTPALLDEAPLRWPHVTFLTSLQALSPHPSHPEVLGVRTETCGFGGNYAAQNLPQTILLALQ